MANSTALSPRRATFSAFLKRPWWPLLGVAAALITSGCGTTAPSGSTAALTGDGRIRSNTLSSGDVIGIGFPSSPELNQTQKIRLDGKISLPMVGEITVAGKSPTQVQEELVVKYKEHLQDPKVVVSLISSVSVVYVNGEVRGGGKVILDRPMTVYEVIMESGGFSPIANPKKVILTRQENGKLVRRVFDMKSGNDSASVYVKPFDTLTVGQSWF